MFSSELGNSAEYVSSSVLDYEISGESDDFRDMMVVVVGVEGMYVVMEDGIFSYVGIHKHINVISLHGCMVLDEVGYSSKLYISCLYKSIN